MRKHDQVINAIKENIRYEEEMYKKRAKKRSSL